MPKLKQNERVALASDIKYRGYVSQILQPQYDGDQNTYMVQWDKSGMYLYVEEALIRETEANKIEAKLNPDVSSTINIVKDKFKKIIKNIKEL
jgi:hypothetical protein